MQRITVGARRIFEEDVPQAFLEDWARLLSNCFKTARATVEQRYSPEMAHDVYPHVRRGLVEDGLFSLVQRYGGEASRMGNAAENCSHTEGIFNQRTLLTAHAVRNASDMARPAVFTARLQREAKQLRFSFMEDGKQKPAADLERGIYAQLLYGPEERKTGFPAFARIVFPDEHGGLVASIDLTALLTRLAYSRRRGEEVIDDTLSLGLIPEKKEESGE